MMLCNVGQLSLQPHRCSVHGSVYRVAVVAGMGALHLLHISAFSSLWLTCLPSAWPTNSRNTCRALDRKWHHSWRPPAGTVIPLDPSILLRRRSNLCYWKGALILDGVFLLPEILLHHHHPWAQGLCYLLSLCPSQLRFCQRTHFIAKEAQPWTCGMSHLSMCLITQKHLAS